MVGSDGRVRPLGLRSATLHFGLAADGNKKTLNLMCPVKGHHLNLDMGELVEKSIEALEKCAFKIKHVDKDIGLIQAQSRLSFWSWTEKINVIVDRSGIVKMKSECYVSTQIIDWGKNRRNVKKFFEYLG